MFDKEFYEVEANEFNYFSRRLKPELFRKQIDTSSIRWYDNRTNELVCESSIIDNNEEKWYIYIIPEDEDLLPPIPIRELHVNEDDWQIIIDELTKNIDWSKYE